MKLKRKLLPTTFGGPGRTVGLYVRVCESVYLDNNFTR